MNKEWSLDILYHGYEDPKFQEDLTKLDSLIGTIQEYVNQTMSEEEPAVGLVHIIEYQERFQRLMTDLYDYVSLRQSTDTVDPETTTLLGRLDSAGSRLSKEFAMMQKYIAGVQELDALIQQNTLLQEYSYMLHEIQRSAKHLLSDEVEEVIAKLNLSGGSQWAMMQQYMTSTVKVPYKNEITNLSTIRNLAYDADRSVRKEAYEAELACYDAIKDGVAFSLNSLKMQVNTISELRGYESALAMTLEDARMTRETLDAMLQAIQEYLPKFHAYLRHKAEVLGYKNGLPWYDLFAPMGSNSKKYTAEEAKEYLISHFQGFAQDLAQMIERAFDEEWIDFYPHDGKVGGAFCAHVASAKQSRVLTNFTGTFSDVVTLAHELGHAYHNEQIHDHRPLNQDYSMPVAETASTFNEVAIMAAAIEEAQGDTKLALIESQLQDTTQIICDILSRYLFESAVFENRKQGFMFPDELCAIMLDAQKKAYGDGLDPEYLHPYMWVCKSHYYSENLSYYNFPYAFGGLFARGLYAQYLEEGEAFLPKYRKLLNQTAVSSVEQTAAMAGLDITKPDFWRKSLAMVADQIDAFIEMTK